MWCWRRLLRVSWTAREIQPVHPKGNQSWILTGRTDAEAKTPILWSPDAKNWFIWKDPDAGEDWRQEEKGTTGWDGWMASPTRWTWVWGGLRSWWWTGKPGVLQSIRSQSWTRLSDWTKLCLCSINETTKLRRQHKYFRLTAEICSVKKDSFQNITTHWQPGHPRALRKIYDGVYVVFMPANTTFIL